MPFSHAAAPVQSWDRYVEPARATVAVQTRGAGCGENCGLVLASETAKLR